MLLWSLLLDSPIWLPARAPRLPPRHVPDRQDDAMAPSMLLDPTSLARRNQPPRGAHAPSGPPLGRSCKRRFLHSRGSTGTLLLLQHREGKCSLPLLRFVRPNEEKSPAAWLLL